MYLESKLRRKKKKGENQERLQWIVRKWFGQGKDGLVQMGWWPLRCQGYCSSLMISNLF